MVFDPKIGGICALHYGQPTIVFVLFLKRVSVGIVKKVGIKFSSPSLDFKNNFKKNIYKTNFYTNLESFIIGQSLSL